MPITARLSRKFYDKLGDDVANELVEWLNAVDTSYRQEFRELFEANFGRLEARFAQQAAEMRAGFAELRTEMAQREKSLIRWMFGFWIGSWAALVGTLIALHQLGLLANR